MRAFQSPSVFPLSSAEEVSLRITCVQRRLTTVSYVCRISPLSSGTYMRKPLKKFGEKNACPLQMQQKSSLKASLKLGISLMHHFLSNREQLMLQPNKATVPTQRNSIIPFNSIHLNWNIHVGWWHVKSFCAWYENTIINNRSLQSRNPYHKLLQTKQNFCSHSHLGTWSTFCH